MFNGYVVCSEGKDKDGHPIYGEHHALCQERATAYMVKKLLEDVWGVKLAVQGVCWELHNSYESKDGRERIGLC